MSHGLQQRIHMNGGKYVIYVCSDGKVLLQIFVQTVKVDHCQE